MGFMIRLIQMGAVRTSEKQNKLCKIRYLIEFNLIALSWIDWMVQFTLSTDIS